MSCTCGRTVSRKSRLEQETSSAKESPATSYRWLLFAIYLGKVAVPAFFWAREKTSGFKTAGFLFGFCLLKAAALRH
jgi:hypothetical protein